MIQSNVQEMTPAQLAADWEANKEVFLRMGLSKAAYCRQPDPSKQLASARAVPLGFVGVLQDLYPNQDDESDDTWDA